MKRHKRQKLISRRADLPLVLMADLKLDVANVAVDYALEWGWDLRALWISGFEWPTDKPVAGVLIGDLPKPAGVFSFADFMIVQVFLACSQAGLSVPEEVGLLGCGNSIVSRLNRIPISSIDTSMDQCVVTALRLLRDLMAGKPAPREPVMVPPEGAVVRTSTDVLTVPDRAIARALRFMWDHFSENISIQNIADAAGLPRRSLERRFRNHLNRSVHDELKRKRVTELRNLLLTTHEPIADLAPRAGFHTLTHANRCFLAAYGVCPGKYRAQHGGAGRVTR